MRVSLMLGAFVFPFRLLPYLRGRPYAGVRIRAHPTQTCARVRVVLFVPVHLVRWFGTNGKTDHCQGGAAFTPTWSFGGGGGGDASSAKGYDTKHKQKHTRARTSVDLLVRFGAFVLFFLGLESSRGG